jgi:hypothetical protein
MGELYNILIWFSSFYSIFHKKRLAMADSDFRFLKQIFPDRFSQAFVARELISRLCCGPATALRVRIGIRIYRLGTSPNATSRIRRGASPSAPKGNDKFTSKIRSCGPLSATDTSDCGDRNPHLRVRSVARSLRSLYGLWLIACGRRLGFLFW